MSAGQQKVGEESRKLRNMVEVKGTGQLLEGGKDTESLGALEGWGEKKMGLDARCWR